MSFLVEVTPELEAELTEEAQTLQLSLSEYAGQILAARPAANALPRNGADLVTYWKEVGVIGSRPEIEDAAEHARELRKKAESRARAMP